MFLIQTGLTGISQELEIRCCFQQREDGLELFLNIKLQSAVINQEIYSLAWQVVSWNISGLLSVCWVQGLGSLMSASSDCSSCPGSTCVWSVSCDSWLGVSWGWYFTGSARAVSSDSESGSWQQWNSIVIHVACWCPHYAVVHLLRVMDFYLLWTCFHYF